MQRLVLPLFLLYATTLSAAPMCRVMEVRDPHTLVVDRNGVAATIILASVAIAPGEEEIATQYLRRTVEGSWVLVESGPAGTSHVYRSPDGLYVNGELARRAFVSGNLHMTYLGEAMPAPARTSNPQPKQPQTTASATTPRLRPARHQPKGAHRIPRM